MATMYERLTQVWASGRAIPDVDATIAGETTAALRSSGTAEARVPQHAARPNNTHLNYHLTSLLTADGHMGLCRQKLKFV
jgi:hypothetical protein